MKYKENIHRESRTERDEKRTRGKGRDGLLSVRQKWKETSERQRKTVRDRDTETKRDSERQRDSDSQKSALRPSKANAIMAVLSTLSGLGCPRS